MDKATVNRMQKVYGLVAKLVGIEVRVAAMTTANAAKIIRCEEEGYPPSAFFQEAAKADEVSKQIGLIPLE